MAEVSAPCPEHYEPGIPCLSAIHPEHEGHLSDRPGGQRVRWWMAGAEEVVDAAG